MQKSWKMRKHSSSLKVSLSSQKKSMSALPSLRRSILRLFKSWSVCAELCRSRKTHFSLKVWQALSEGDEGLSQQRHTGPGPATLWVRVSLFMLHNSLPYFTCRKGSSCCCSASSPWTFSSRDLMRTYKEENSNSMFSTEILHQGVSETRSLVMNSHYPCSNRTSNTDSMIIHYMRVERKGGGGSRRGVLAQELHWLHRGHLGRLMAASSCCILTLSTQQLGSNEATS